MMKVSRVVDPTREEVVVRKKNLQKSSPNECSLVSQSNVDSLKGETCSCHCVRWPLQPGLASVVRADRARLFKIERGTESRY